MTTSSLDNALNTNPLLTRWFALAAILVLWMATRPYTGIVVDAQLYTFQAMAKLAPSKLSGDLFLKYGSQDKFTIYAYILAYAIFFIGIVKANFVMTMCGAALWLTAITFLTKNLFTVFSYRILAIFSVIILSPNYGAAYFYAQQYQSPRLYGEAIAIAAIAFALRRMWWRACLALAVGVIVHPLMILYGIGIVFVFAAMDKRQLWLLPPVGMILLVGLSRFGIDPFDRISNVIPTDWWTTVIAINWADFVTRWHLPDYVLILMQINIGLLAFWIGEGIERRLLQALAIVVTVSLLTSLIGADWLHDLLIVNAQFYRATFLLSTIINMFSGVLFLRLLKQKGISKYYLIFSLGLTIIDRYFPLELFPVCILLFLSSLTFWWETKSGKISRLWALPLFAMALLVGASTLMIFYFEIKIQLTLPYNFFFFISLGLITSFSACVFTFFRWNKIIASITLMATLLFGLLNFDQRTPWQNFVESDIHPATAILTLIDTSDNIYWEDGLDYLWFNLQHTSYYSPFQCVGSMFYKSTADHCKRRGTVLSKLDTSDFDTRNNHNTGFPKQDFNKNGPTSIAQIKDVCQALPELDLIVLFTKVPDFDPVEWTAPVAQYSNEINSAGVASLQPQTHYYFYNCRTLRTDTSIPGGLQKNL